MNFTLNADLSAEEAIVELQRSFDQERLAPHLNLVTRKAKCEQQIPSGDGLSPAPCTHDALLQFAEMIICQTCSGCGEPTGCGHKTKQVTVRLCLLHYVARIERYVDPQMDLTNERDVAEGQKTATVRGDYGFTASDVDREFCICGWKIDSPIDGHDKRHASYLAGLEEAPDELALRRGKKSGGTMAAGASKRKAGAAKKKGAKKRPARGAKA